MTRELARRYLALLGVRERAPGAEALAELVRAHILRVPFENVSKLYYKRQLGLRGIPGLEPFLDGIARHNFGGTCYSNAYHFSQLLAALGYEADLCGADMSNPDVHLVSMVSVEHRDYLIDVGYAAPFLIPLPRNLSTDHIIALGRDRYVLKPRDAQGRSRMEAYRDGELAHGYTAKPEPRDIREFDQVIADSYRGEATFMNELLLARFYSGSSTVIRNLTLTESRGTVSTIQTLADAEELVQAVYEHFGIPAEFTFTAVQALRR